MLKKEVKLLKKEIKRLKKSNRRLINAKNKLKSNLKRYQIIVDPRSKKYQHLSAKSKRQKLRNIKEVIQEINMNISEIGLKISNSIISEYDGDTDTQITDKFYSYFDYCSTPKETLYIKDKYFFTDKDYEVIKKKYNAPIPEFFEIKDERDKQNKELDKETIKIDDNCFFYSISKQIERHSINFLRKKSSNNSSKIIIKICADGKEISRNMKIINFAFTVSDETIHDNSVYAHHILGIAKAEESYEGLTKPMEYLMKELKKVQSISFNNITTPIEYCFAGDYKLLLILLGLEAARSNHSCIFCLSHKKDFKNKEMSNEVRDFSEWFEFINLRENKGFKNKPLIDLEIIPLKRVIICTLHMRLRIFDVLLEDLITELANIDKLKDDQTIDLKIYSNLGKFIIFLKECCGININPSSTFNKKKPAKIFRSLTGGEILTLLETINLKVLFPDLEFMTERDVIWKKFFSLDKKIRKLNYKFEGDREFEIDSIKTDIDEFMIEFEKIFIRERGSTPYIHILTCHVGEIIENFNITDFSQQGLEKLNDFSTKEYYLSTNKKETLYSNPIIQMLFRKLRIDNFEDK